MRVFLVFVAIFGLASADDLSDMKMFLECYHKALIEGVPSIPIPKHDPHYVSYFHFNGSTSYAEYDAHMYDNIFYDLANYTILTLNATNYHDLDMVAFFYEFYWPKMNFTDSFDLVFTTYDGDMEVEGKYTAVLYDVNWSGILNLTKYGQDIPTNVDDFTLHSSTSDVTVELTPINENESLDDLVKEELTKFFNDMPRDVVRYIKDDRFNDFWLGHPERINNLLSFCGLV